MGRDRRSLALLVLVLPLTGGCGGTSLYPVEGRVEFEDGAPLVEGLVVCEADVAGRLVTARGEVGADGRFRLGTHSPGDGAFPGVYRVAVTTLVRPKEAGDLHADQTLDPKFRRMKTSGLSLEVGKTANEVVLRVARDPKVKQ